MKHLETVIVWLAVVIFLVAALVMISAPIVWAVQGRPLYEVRQ